MLELFKLPMQSFRWRCRNGIKVTPQAMETRHLFMTLVMIWNHTMPRGSEIRRSGNWQHHMYTLGPTSLKST